MATGLAGGCVTTTSPPPSVGATGFAGPSASIASACPPSAGGQSPSATAPASLDRPGWWNDRVFYEVFVRSFADSDGDGTGDLAGLIAHLDYLNDGDPATTSDLGITGIWLMPVAESPSYHGYDATDLRAVEHDYGSLETMRALVSAAHDRGVAVITDLVLNHTSDQHPWFLDSLSPGSAHDDWYIWSEENPGHGGPDGQDVWHEAGGRYYYGLFGPDLPDLNLGNAEVTAELRDVARYWLTDVGVDGFRLDAIKHLVEEGRTQVHTAATHAWLRDFRAAVTAIKPGVLLVGEVSDVAAGGSQYVPEDVDLVFDFGVAGATVDAIRAGQGGQLRTAVDDAIRLYRPGERASFLTNHDQERVASRLRGDDPALGLAGRMLLSDPGVPFVYYGEEVGLTGEKPDERIRTPMPWDGTQPGGGFTTGTPWEALEPGWEDRNVASQMADPGSLLSTYRRAIRLRLEHPALRGGDTFLLESDNDAVVATLRAGSTERLLVVANLGDAVVSDYALTLGSSDLCGEVRASVVGSGSTGPPPDVAPPLIDGSGGIAGYRPLPDLPARSLTIIALEH